MTISVEDTKAAFEGDGTTVNWPFSFKVNSIDDLYVAIISVEGFETALDNWTVTLNANQNSNPGGYITTESPVAEGVPGFIRRNLSFTRIAEFTDSIPPEIVEEELDRLTQYALQLREKQDRSLHVSAATQTFANVNLGSIARRRAKVITFDTDGNAVNLAVSGSDITGPTGPTRVSRAELSAPAFFRQDINGAWSHTTCTVTFVWSLNGTTEQTRSVVVTIDTGNNRFNTPTPVTGVTITQDAGKLLTTLSSTYNNVTEYIQLAVVRKSDPIYASADFAPTWGTGQFGTPPSGNVHATNAAGVVTLTLAAAREATSSSTAMSWDAGSIPSAYRPAANRTCMVKARYNSTLVTVGLMTIGSNGSATFARYNGETGTFDAAGWQSGDTKGLPQDFTAIYAL
jgi:hypothetical protein